MQSLLIFLAILLGILLPYGYEYTWLFRPNLMVMLFFSFLGVQFKKEVVRRNHFVILGLNLTLPLVLFSAVQFINRDAALAVFTVSIAPTAVAATVLADFFKKDVSYVTASVLLTSPVIALALPLIGNPLHLSATPVTYRHPPPRFGADTAALDADDPFAEE